MHSKRSYTDSDRAMLLVVLKTNNGNIARSSRDTGIPEATIRDWKKDWEANGIPEELLTPVQEQSESIIEDMERVRYKALQLLEAQLPTARSIRDLATVFGIVDDKIRLARGLATSRTETTHELPAPEKMAEMFRAIVSGALEAQNTRAKDISETIDDSHVVEQAPRKALKA